MASPRRLHAYQRRGVDWMARRETAATGIKGGILADDMGLGKTVQMLEVIRRAPRRGPNLICVPLSVVDQWAEEIQLFEFKYALVTSNDVSTNNLNVDELKTMDIILCPHSAFTSTPFNCVFEHPLVVSFFFNRIVVDEAHALKNPNSKLAACLTEARAAVRWGLTGTPVVCKTRDVRGLVIFLNGNRRAWPTVGEALDMVPDLVLRRTKEDVAHEVERMRFVPTHATLDLVDFNRRERVVYARTYRQARSTYSDADMDSASERAHLLSIISTLRQHCSKAGCKLDALADHFAAHPSRTRSLVFCNFRKEIDAVVDKLQQDPNVDVVMTFHGGMRQEQRREVIEAFMDSSASTSIALVMQIQAGSEGLNLQEASYVYIMSPHWNASREMQAIARAHRVNTTHRVNVVRFVVKDSIEERMHRGQQTKLRDAADVLGDQRLSVALAATDGTDVSWGVLQHMFDSDIFDGDDGDDGDNTSDSDYM